MDDTEAMNHIPNGEAPCEKFYPEFIFMFSKIVTNIFYYAYLCLRFW